jgi:hypothetical protein
LTSIIAAAGYDSGASRARKTPTQPPATPTTNGQAVVTRPDAVRPSSWEARPDHREDQDDGDRRPAAARENTRGSYSDVRFGRDHDIVGHSGEATARRAFYRPRCVTRDGPAVARLVR